MSHTVDVVFENGVFRPLKPVGIQEGTRFRMRMEKEIEEAPDEILALAAEVLQGISDEEIDEIEQIALNRKDFFIKRPT